MANHFLSEFCGQYRKETKLSDGALKILFSYSWPGNVRELRNVLDYAVNMTERPLITTNDLPSYLILSKAKNSFNRGLQLSSGAEELQAPQDRSVYKNIMDSFEKELIESALNRSRNRTEAMKLLGLSRRAFYLKANKHGLI